MPPRRDKRSARQLGCRAPSALLRDFDAAVSELGLVKRRAVGAAVAAFVAARPAAQFLLCRDLFLRYYAADGAGGPSGEADRSTRSARLNCSLPPAIVRRFTQTARRLGLTKGRALAAAVSAFTHLPPDVARRLYARTCREYFPESPAPARPGRS